MTIGYSVNDYTKLADALLNNHISIQDDGQDTTDSGNEDVDNLAEIQAIFNVMAQVELERAKLMDSNVLSFWTGFVRDLWNKGRGYLKKKLCSQEQNTLKTILQELTSEEFDTVTDDNTNGNDEEEVRAQLQVLFNARQKVKAHMMKQGGKLEAKVEASKNSIDK